jgi:hypothetical protein
MHGRTIIAPIFYHPRRKHWQAIEIKMTRIKEKRWRERGKKKKKKKKVTIKKNLTLPEISIRHDCVKSIISVNSECIK